MYLQLVQVIPFLFKAFRDVRYWGAITKKHSKGIFTRPISERDFAVS
jgi:hypothetical protein